MLSDLQFDLARFRMYERTVIAPAAFGRRISLRAEVFQTRDHLSPTEAQRAQYAVVEPGWRWGPAWSSAWFRLSGSIPDDWRGSIVALRFSSGTEALWWDEAGPRRGFDVNRETAVAFDPCTGGETFHALIEAACNHPFGIATFSWDQEESRRRWQSESPGEFRIAELVELHPRVQRLERLFRFTRQLVEELADTSHRAQQLAAAMRRAVTALNDCDIPGSAECAITILQTTLNAAAAPQGASRCFAAGHAHIDTAWLWPIAETRRKCLRTFVNVLDLMDRHPDFRFIASQSQQYAWVEENSPALFDRIRARIHEGRWEAGGSMWIEPDCNVPSGESLIRQILHGCRYWQQRFGDAAVQRHLFLPDTFGFPASLPQIIAASGLDTFITNKIAWSRFNAFPHVNFRWRGLDGSEVLTHFTPAATYNAANTPAELRRGERTVAQRERGRTDLWLQLYGFGDGGGGPTEEMIDAADSSRICEGLPQVQSARVDEFCAALHEQRNALRSCDDDLPVWDGELYLELHRGTYTTHQWLKQANARAEQRLRLIEWLLAAGPAALRTPERAADLDRIWKLLLLNQFHDILPGSSIPEVYADARRDHEEIERFADATLSTLLESLPGTQEGPSLVNASSFPQGGVVEIGDDLAFAERIPPLAIMPLRIAQPAHSVSRDGFALDNGLIRATLDETGRVTSLRTLPDGLEVAAEPLNTLHLYEDRPYEWDAWEIDEEYLDKPIELSIRNVRCRPIADFPLRCGFEIAFEFGVGSSITQRITLDADSPRLNVAATVDWHESHRLLRVLFPTTIRARRATCNIQFGQIERPTHRNTSWDRAMFEVCAHRWIDLAQPGHGLALLNRAIFGCSCSDSTLGLTLLRSPTHPDPDADRGRNNLHWSLMPHHGDWRAAGVDREADCLNQPLMLTADRAAHLPPVISIHTDPPVHLEIAALKPADDDSDDLILRLVEVRGAAGPCAVTWNTPLSRVTNVDLLGRPASSIPVEHDQASGRTTFAVRPYQIITLRAARDQSRLKRT